MEGYLSREQVMLLLERAKVVDKKGQLYPMILLSWRHGLRAEEVCHLQVRDFDLRGGVFTVQRLKGSERTTQQLFTDELAVLPRLLGGKGPTEYLFPGQKVGEPRSYAGYYDRFVKLCQELGFPRHLSHPHCLKHSVAMIVIKQGIEYCRAYLGHKSIASTGAYLRVSDAEASRAAMAAFGD